MAAGGRARSLGSAVAALVVMQVAAGFVNVLLLAPVWLQLVHLLLADLIWLSYVLLGAQVLGQEQPAGRVAALES
jgi:heme A synthase